jgi:hypothetical protein
MLLTRGNTVATLFLTASVVGFGGVLLGLSTLTQRQATAAAPGNTRQEAQPTPPSSPDEEKRAQEALKTAEARYKEAAIRLEEATKQLQAARANHERLEAARNAGAIRQHLQSLDWVFLRTGTDVAPSGKPVTTIHLRSTNRKGPAANELSDFLSLEVPLAKDVKVRLGGREGKVADLRMGMRVSLQLARAGPEVVKIDATSIRSGAGAVLKAIDTGKKTITVTLGEKVTLEGLPLDEDDTPVSIEDRRGRLTDLKPGMRVFLSLGVRGGLVVVRQIQASK